MLSFYTLSRNSAGRDETKEAGTFRRQLKQATYRVLPLSLKTGNHLASGRLCLTRPSDESLPFHISTSYICLLTRQLWCSIQAAPIPLPPCNCHLPSGRTESSDSLQVRSATIATAPRAMLLIVPQDRQTMNSPGYRLCPYRLHPIACSGRRPFYALTVLKPCSSHSQWLWPIGCRAPRADCSRSTLEGRRCTKSRSPSQTDE
jgi:hypothetical protein